MESRVELWQVGDFKIVVLVTILLILFLYMRTATATISKYFILSKSVMIQRMFLYKWNNHFLNHKQLETRGCVLSTCSHWCPGAKAPDPQFSQCWRSMYCNGLIIPPAQQSWRGVYLIHLVRTSVRLSVRPSVCRRHGFRSISQVALEFQFQISYACWWWP